MPNDSITRAEFVEFARANELSVVATTDSAGNPEAALVNIAVTDDAEILFNTKVAARKTGNIAGNARVALVVGTGAVSIQVEGVADILSGEQRQAYAQTFQQLLPRSRALTDDFALVRLTPQWLRYLDVRPDSFRLVESSWQ